MTYLSIIEKFQILFNILLDFKFILVFIGLLIIFTFLYTIKKISNKKYILFMFISFIVLFLISIITNYEILSNTFDNFTTIVFGNIYFPSIYVYIGVLIISLISFITSMLNRNLEKMYKVINTIMFVLNNILFIIILNIIAKNKIDIFSVNSLYSDTTLVAILELNMGLFILWLLSLIIIYTTNCLSERLTHKKVRNIEPTKTEITFNPILELNSDIVSNEKENDNFITTLVETIDNNEDSIDNTELVIEMTAHEDDSVTALVETIDNNEDSIDNTELVIEMTAQEDDSVVVQENNEINNNIHDEEMLTVQKETSDYHIESAPTFNDILNGNISVTYYDNNINEEEYELIDPQKIYENKYNNIKSENMVFNDINKQIDNNIKEEILVEDRNNDNKLITDAISLNDLIQEEENNAIDVLENEMQQNRTNKLEMVTEIPESVGYTIDDYKKISEMLNELKKHSKCTIINIDDAVALSLISNYSIDDCMKLKNILQNNLN